MQAENRHPFVKRAMRSARSSLALLVATIAVFFSVHAAACNICTAPTDDHSTARLTRSTQTDFVSTFKGAGKDLPEPSSGGSGIGALLPGNEQGGTVPVLLAEAAFSAFSAAESRNTALAHRAVTVLLI